MEPSMQPMYRLISVTATTVLQLGHSYRYHTRNGSGASGRLVGRQGWKGIASLVQRGPRLLRRRPVPFPEKSRESKRGD
eukprot:5882678-Prorocentrum_lima.AAC.1